MVENKKQISFENNLYSALSICEGKFCYNSEFSRIYSFTTENIAGYIDYFDFDNEIVIGVTRIPKQDVKSNQQSNRSYITAYL